MNFFTLCMAGLHFILSDELHSKICHSNQTQFKLYLHYELCHTWIDFHRVFAMEYLYFAVSL
jgi:hypothetical protein